MVSIPRDTMTYITVYAADTQKEYVLYDHLSLQFGYGDGKHKSCQLTKNAVSALLYNIPIQGYFAMPLDALGSLVKNVEGVEVETPNASLEFETDSFHPGSVVTLDEDNIEEFLRTRDTDEDNSALLRMERQKVFLRAFIDKVRDNYKENPGTLTGLYEDMKPYVVTNIGNDQLADLMDSLSGQVGVKEWTLPGEGVATGEYDEFRVDQDALVGRLVETFCVKS
jgi:anionic cell wall polymer biosynthesis LytR-Cps2A-Psr (LCP) family protein